MAVPVESGAASFLEVTCMIGIIACTKECNMRCKYCFEEENFKSDYSVPSAKINADFQLGIPNFERFGRELIEYNRKRGFRTEFTFHGGEPMLIKPELIAQLCEYYISLNPAVLFNVQTNGTICTEEMLELLRKYRFRVGVSIDGTEALHDENRVFPNGHGTHSVVMQNIRKMQKAGIQLGAMATITDSVTNAVGAFYNFFAENGLDIGFNACYNSPNSTNQANQIDDVLYSKFLKDLFDIWVADNAHQINIQPFERILRTMVTKTKGMQVCQFIQDCREVNVSIDITGNIFRCLHYCNIANSELGNINSRSLESIMCDFLRQPSHWDKVKNGKCGSCDIQHYCYGGCPYWSDAKELTGLEGDFSCKSQKFIVHYIYNYLSKHISGQ